MYMWTAAQELYTACITSTVTLRHPNCDTLQYSNNAVISVGDAASNFQKSQKGANARGHGCRFSTISHSLSPVQEKQNTQPRTGEL